MSNEEADTPRYLNWATFKAQLPDVISEHFIPLGDESVRTYAWANNNEVYFEDPVALAVLEDGSHLVVSNEGELVTIPTPHRNNITVTVQTRGERSPRTALTWLQTLRFADPYKE